MYNPAMERLWEYCRSWNDCGIKPASASPHDMYVLDAVCVDLDNDGKAEFIQAEVKRILEDCGFHINQKGCGYTVKVTDYE